MCNVASPEYFASLEIFKHFLRIMYATLLDFTYNIDMPGTWSNVNVSCMF